MRGGFHYTPPRQIQYGRINPVEGLRQGISQGIELGMKRRREESGIEVDDPGVFEDMDKSQFLTSEIADLEKIEKFDKETSGDSADQRAINYGNMVKQGMISSKIVKYSLQSGVKPKELRDVMKSVELNDPMADIKIRRLAEKIGIVTNPKTGEVSGPGKVILDKQKEILGARTEQVDRALSNIREYYESPSSFLGKGTQLHETMAGLVRNEMELVAELQRLDPNRAKAHLEARKAQRGRAGGKPHIAHLIDEEGRRGTYINGVLVKSQSHPDFTRTGAVPITKADMISGLMGKGMPVKRKRNVQTKLKKLYPKGKRITDKDMRKISKLLGGIDEAELFILEQGLKY